MKAHLILLSTLLLAAPGWAAEPVLAITVDEAILRLQEPPATTKTVLRVAPLNFPTGARLTYAWQQIQDVMSCDAAPMTERKIVFSAADQPTTSATFPGSGLYAIRLTVTDPASARSASRNTWINVWDHRSPILVNGKPDPLAVIPGMRPPKVRNLSPDPGPFQHPRLYCSDSDWKDINQRCVQGRSKLAAAGWAILLSQFGNGVDAKSADGILLAKIEAYADAGFKGPAPDLIRGKPEPKDYEMAMLYLTARLGQACFVQWVKTDPALPQAKVPAEDQARCRSLAKQTGALSRILLNAQIDRSTGAFKKDQPGFIRNFDAIGDRTANLHGMALAYDFIYAWMTPEQQRDTRNLLIAAGLGRKGDGQRTGHANAGDRWVERGYEQNGNFPSLGETNLLTGLVVQGEESGADPLVVKTFLNPPKPADFAKVKGPLGYDLVQPVDADTGRDQPLSKPYPEASTWPHARKADVNNLQRQIWSWQDGHVTPWGFTLERLAYFGSMTDEVLPQAVIYARFGGFNQYVGCSLYQTVNNLIFAQYPSGGIDSTTVSKSFTSPMGMYEHHSGGGDYRQQHILLLKYMYPEDPLVDYAYATQAPQIENRVRNPLNTCLFGMDPTITDLKEALAPVAAAKELPLTKLDPQEGIVVLRSGWKDDDAMLYFDAGASTWGHMNAERSAFAFFALGRHWAVPTSFHKIFGNFQSLVSVQNPAWAACAVTQGYMSVNPSFVPEVPDGNYNASFPTPPSKLLEVRESPDQLWSVAACDAKISYNYTFGAPKDQPTAVTTMVWSELFYPGFTDFMAKRIPAHPILRPTYLRNLSSARGCGLTDALRTVLMVRGSRPYALIVDDFRKEAPTNWRWMMNDKITMKEEGRAKNKDDASFCVIMAPGSTATEAVLLHQRDQGEQPGQPRLLVRDVSEVDNSAQPAIRMDQTSFKLGEAKYSLENTNRVFIERQNVTSPAYKVLLFPYRTGEKPPVTTWDTGHTVLTVDLGGGIVDRIACTRTAGDPRTRLDVVRTSSPAR